MTLRAISNLDSGQTFINKPYALSLIRQALSFKPYALRFGR